MKLRKFSLRLTVGTMFVVATLITGFVAVSWQYYFSKKMAMENTVQSLSQASADLSEYAQSLDRNATNTARLLASISQVDDIRSNEIKLRNLLAEVMKENTLFYSIYFGSENEDSYQVINLDSSEIVRDKIAAKPSDRWVVIKINGPKENRIRKTYFYNSRFILRDVVTTNSNFFPTARPWYQSAETGTVFKTKPYLFTHLKITGQTYSLRLPKSKSQTSSTVLGIDIVLSSIEDKLSLEGLNLENSRNIESYLYDASGEVISSNQQTVEKASIPESTPLSLTPLQRSVIANAPKIMISNQNDWLPLDFSLAGQPQGYAVDILLLVEQMTGIDFEFINGFSWSELVNKYNDRSLDGLHSLHKSSDVEYEGAYSDPLYNFELALVTRKELGVVRNYAELAGKKVAILSGWGIADSLRQRFPQTEVLEFDDRNQAFKSVSEGDTDAVVDIKTSINSKPVTVLLSQPKIA